MGKTHNLLLMTRRIDLGFSVWRFSCPGAIRLDMACKVQVESSKARTEDALPTVFREAGFRFHFYSNEGNEPPHVHITGKGGEMKVWIPEMSVEFSYRLSASEQRKIISLVKKNLDLLLEKWNEFTGKKD